MPRLIYVTVPSEHVGGVAHALNQHVSVHSLSTVYGPNSTLLRFRTSDKGSDGVLDLLEALGVGVEFGVVDIVSLLGTRPRLGPSGHGVERKKKKRKYKISDRASLEEIYEVVDSANHLTFNYLGFILVAALIAAVGLATNSEAVVVASMLVSPLMGPIMAMTFGTAVADPVLRYKGARNEAIGFFLCFAVGFVWAFATWPFPAMWGTNEQISRGGPAGVYAGIALAIPSGIGVGLATTGGGLTALVGCAISAALLPPIVNSGQYVGYAIVQCTPIGGTQKCSHSLIVAGYSTLIFAVNVIFIFIFALIVFKIKRVRPITAQSEKYTHLKEDWYSLTYVAEDSAASISSVESGPALGRGAGRGDTDLMFR